MLCICSSKPRCSMNVSRPCVSPSIMTIFLPLTGDPLSNVPGPPETPPPLSSSRTDRNRSRGLKPVRPGEFFRARRSQPLGNGQKNQQDILAMSTARLSSSRRQFQAKPHPGAYGLEMSCFNAPSSSFFGPSLWEARSRPGQQIYDEERRYCEQGREYRDQGEIIDFPHDMSLAFRPPAHEKAPPTTRDGRGRRHRLATR